MEELFELIDSSDFDEIYLKVGRLYYIKINNSYSWLYKAGGLKLRNVTKNKKVGLIIQNRMDEELKNFFESILDNGKNKDSPNSLKSPIKKYFKLGSNKNKKLNQTVLKVMQMNKLQIWHKNKIKKRITYIESNEEFRKYNNIYNYELGTNSNNQLISGTPRVNSKSRVSTVKENKTSNIDNKEDYNSPAHSQKSYHQHRNTENNLNDANKVRNPYRSSLNRKRLSNLTKNKFCKKKKYSKKLDLLDPEIFRLVQRREVQNRPSSKNGKNSKKKNYFLSKNYSQKNHKKKNLFLEFFSKNNSRDCFSRKGSFLKGKCRSQRHINTPGQRCSLIGQTMNLSRKNLDSSRKKLHAKQNSNEKKFLPNKKYYPHENRQITKKRKSMLEKSLLKKEFEQNLDAVLRIRNDTNSKARQKGFSQFMKKFNKKFSQKKSLQRTGPNKKTKQGGMGFMSVQKLKKIDYDHFRGLFKELSVSLSQFYYLQILNYLPREYHLYTTITSINLHRTI